MVLPGLVAALVVVGLLAASLVAFLLAAAAVDPFPAEAAPDVPYEEVRIPRAEAPDLAGWWVPSSAETDSAVLCVHGHPRSKAAIWESVRFLRDDHHLLLLDLRAHGDSDGRWTTFGRREAHDVQAAVAYLRDRDEVDRVGAWGVSLGAAAILLSRAPGLQAAVLESPFADLPGAVSVPGPSFLDPPIRLLFSVWAWLLMGLDVRTVRPVDAAGELPFPALLVQGTADRTVPPEHARRIAEAGGEAVETWFVEGAGHDGCREAEPAAYEERVGGFLREHLSR